MSDAFTDIYYFLFEDEVNNEETDKCRTVCSGNVDTFRENSILVANIINKLMKKCVAPPSVEYNSLIF